MNWKTLKFFAISLVCFLASEAHAQDDAFTCFNAQEILFPLSLNDFSTNEVLVNDKKYNAFYYLYEDKYSFWYKFIPKEEGTIRFSVAPSNESDRYRAMAFKYSGTDFCDKLVNESIDPLKMERAAIFLGEDKILYRNTMNVAKGDTIYISVLSLNRDDCGHFLHVKWGNEELSLHAVHQPCYNFVFLEIPDYSAAKMIEEDVGLDLDFSSLDSTEDLSGYKAIKTIEVQAEDEAFVEVGDKLVLNQVFFYNNTYALKPGAEKELDQLVNFLVWNDNISVEIQGHTANDSQDIKPDPNFKGQGKEWNFRGTAFELSERRAEAVRDYLIQKGIDESRLKAVGYGDTQKRFPDAETFEESEKNMRVEVLVIPG
jgi:outer membrane protein OmpA-like peptidoglycan-associated protein